MTTEELEERVKELEERLNKVGILFGEFLTFEQFIKLAQLDQERIKEEIEKKLPPMEVREKMAEAVDKAICESLAKSTYFVEGKIILDEESKNENW